MRPELNVFYASTAHTSPQMAWHDLSGALGALCILAAYGLQQTGRLTAEQLAYPLLNALGALLVLHSLLHAFNLAAFILELAWFILSLVGIGRYFRRPE